MRALLVDLSVGIVCLIIGLVVGVYFAPQLKSTELGLQITSLTQKATGKPDGDSPFEEYAFPTIKWRAKALSDGPDSIARLWTKYEPSGNQSNRGNVKYRLTMFKANSRQICEVQLLDDQGFKILQFNASDFHTIPGAPDIVEARESFPCTEEDYRKARDYSIK